MGGEVLALHRKAEGNLELGWGAVPVPCPRRCTEGRNRGGRGLGPGREDVGLYRLEGEHKEDEPDVEEEGSWEGILEGAVGWTPAEMLEWSLRKRSCSQHFQGNHHCVTQAL